MPQNYTFGGVMDELVDYPALDLVAPGSNPGSPQQCPAAVDYHSLSIKYDENKTEAECHCKLRQCGFYTPQGVNNRQSYKNGI